MGLEPLTAGNDAVPAYFEPRHGCDMEVLRYDSRAPHPRYLAWVEQLRELLLKATVIADPRPFLPESAAVSMPGTSWIPLPAFAGAY
jgi:hypothetical protein